MATIERADGSTVEVGPSHCPAGHDLTKPGSVLISGDVVWRTYLCRKCGLQIRRRYDGSETQIVQQTPG